MYKNYIIARFLSGGGEGKVFGVCNNLRFSFLLFWFVHNIIMAGGNMFKYNVNNDKNLQIHLI